MTATFLVIWISAMLIGFGLSAVYSGLETGSYRINPVRLHILDHAGDPRARRLRRLTDNRSSLLSTLLIGNNIANYMGAAAMTVLLESAGFSEWQVIGLNLVIVTPILLIVGETLPKDFCAAHADRIMYPAARFLVASRWLFRLILIQPVVLGFSALLNRLLHEKNPIMQFHPRRRVWSLVKEGVGYGLLSEAQSDMIQRAMSLSARTIDQEMTPWADVIRVAEDAEPAVLWDLAHETSRSRFPVVDQFGRAIGIVSLKRVLRLGKAQCPPICELMRSPLMLPADTPLREALQRMQRARREIAIVIDRGEKPVGVVTIKDLIEPITGELTSW